MKAKKQNDSLLLLQDHPQSSTHIVIPISAEKRPIPNFVNVPPRRGNEDDEYYFKAMLTMFKPWRSGSDLKNETESWSTAFRNTEFCNEHMQVMKNFNIRYECSDARADFHAQRLKDSHPISWMSSVSDQIDSLEKEARSRDLLSALAENNEFPDDLEENDESYFDIPIMSTFEQNKIKEMQDLLYYIRWFETIDSVKEKDSLDDNHPESLPTKQPSIWAEIIDRTRKQVLLSSHSSQASPHSTNPTQCNKSTSTILNDVKVTDLYDLQNKVYVEFENPLEEQLVQQLIDEYTLNEDQSRALRLLSIHALNSSLTNQLLMYIGGMAGTGKSQVIKCFIDLFELKKMRQSLAILAPTGSAAVLIGGSTYHSFLGMSPYTYEEEGPSTSSKAIFDLKEKMRCIKYVLIDEVSMISCRDLYNISHKLAIATGRSTVPFGGVNMIFAGDFGQLKPVGGSSLYDESIGTVMKKGMTQALQEAVIGKALWHQVNTVVLLRENMRQRSQTTQDASFRRVLENVRMAKCSRSDLQFLRSLVAGRGPGKNIYHPEVFKFKSIITARNVCRDYINEVSAQHFAIDNNRPLHTFYSIDRTPSNRKRKSHRFERHSALSNIERKLLWDLPPGRTAHFPGKLTLCVGMPVMIKKNEATELCITNGAEGTVYSWDAETILGKEYLKTLFVKLSNPPKEIKIDELPMNVVPIPRRSEIITCKLSSQESRSILRSQVPVILNFAMADYCSQGKTRLVNPIHLKDCRNHQSVYTCLSRSSCAGSTIILEDFPDEKITNGLNGDLRLEFRELEMLNEITRRQLSGTLNNNVKSIVRRELIKQFVTHEDPYIPRDIHNEIQWNDMSPFLENLTHTESWQIISKSDRKRSLEESNAETKYQNVNQSRKQPRFSEPKMKLFSNSPKPLPPNISLSNQVNINPRPAYIENEPRHHLITRFQAPKGLSWDSQNFSCAYDSLFPILYHLWQTTHFTQRSIFSEFVFDASPEFSSVQNNQLHFEHARDLLRYRLRNTEGITQNTIFPNGRSFSSAHLIANFVLRLKNGFFIKCNPCSSCQQIIFTQQSASFFFCDPSIKDFRFYELLSSQTVAPHTLSLQGWLDHILHSVVVTCPQCTCTTESTFCETSFCTIPSIIGFQTFTSHLNINFKLDLIYQPNSHATYRLIGIIYHGQWHYTCAIIDSQKNIWYSDGMKNSGAFEYRGTLIDNNTNQLYSITDNGFTKYACIILYVLE